MEEKLIKCGKCGGHFPLSNFFKNATRKNGASGYCKKCHSEEDRKRYFEKYKNDPDYVKHRSEVNKKWYQKNKERSNLKSRKNEKRIRLEVLNHYGGKCACCGESRHEFLAIDHISGGGRKHRSAIGGKIHRWLQRNNFPEGFRVLCHNCNMSLGLYGYCPHQRERAEAESRPVAQMARVIIEKELKGEGK